MKIPILLTALSISFALPLAAQVAGPEFPLTPSEPGPADHSQKAPSVATDGEVFFVSWTNTYASRAEIYAARVSRTGQLLDEISFPVAIKPDGGYARVVWTGRVFLLMHSFVGKRFSRDGRLLSSFDVAPGLLESLTCNSSNCLAVYETLPYTGTLRGTLLNLDGEVVVTDILIAGFGSGQQFAATTTSNGDGFLVSWSVFDRDAPTSQYSVQARTISNSGSVGPLRQIASAPTTLGTPAVAANGAEYLLAWTVGSQPIAVQSVRLDSTGSPGRNVTTLFAGHQIGHNLELASWDSGYLMLLNNRNLSRLEAFHVSADATRVEGSEIAFWPMREDGTFDVVTHGSDAFVAREAPSPLTHSDIHGSFFRATDGNEEAPLVVSQTARPQLNPALAGDAETMLAVWEEQMPGNLSRIMGKVVGDNSTHARVITPEFDHATSPRIAFNGSNYLVTWTEGIPSGLIKPRRVIARTVSRDGRLLGEPELVTDRSSFQSQVATNGVGYLVTWAEFETGLTRLHGTLLAQDGGVLRDFPISTQEAPVRPGGVAWGAGQYAVSWLESRYTSDICDPSACPYYAVVVARFNDEGVRLGTIEFPPDYRTVPPQVTWDGQRFLVTWEDYGQVVASRVGTDGSTESPRRFSDRGAGDAIIWDGTAFIGIGVRSSDSTFRETDLILAHVTHAQLDSGSGAPAVRITDTVDDEFKPTIAAIGPRQYVILYQRTAHELEYGSANRVFARHITFPPRARAVRR